MIWFLVILIYIIGYIVAYYNTKLINNFLFKKAWTWEEISFSLKMSCLSWIWLILTYLFAAFHFFDGIEYREGKPPKWL